MPPDAAEMVIAQACMLYKEEKFEEARQKF
jgi:hypothetical protein